MIEKIAKIVSELQYKHTNKVLAFFIIISILLLPGIALLPGQVEPSLERVMPGFIEELTVINHMRTQFGSDITYIVLKAEGPIYDVRSSDSIEYMKLLEESLQPKELIIGTESIASRNQEATDLMNKQYNLAIIKVITDTGSDATKIGEVVEAIERDIEQLEAENPGLTHQITGFNVLDKVTFNVIMSDFLVISGLSMAGIALLLWLFFRNGKKVLLAMSVLFLAVFWTMGITGYLSFTITVVSMVSVAMIMGLGIDFSVHVMHTYYDYRKKNTPKKSLELMHKELLRAILGAAATTIAGFLALLFGVLPAMQTLALILAIGILTTVIGAIGFMPILLLKTEQVKQ